MQQSDAAAGPSSRREELASTGREQTQKLLATCYQILESCSDSEPSGAQADQLQRLQDEYLSIAAALRAMLLECKQLQSQEAAAAAAAAAGSETSASGA